MMKKYKYYQYVIIKPINYPDYVIKIVSDNVITHQTVIEKILSQKHGYNQLRVQFINRPKTEIV